jgi:hypothetical protein
MKYGIEGMHQKHFDLTNALHIGVAPEEIRALAAIPATSAFTASALAIELVIGRRNVQTLSFFIGLHTDLIALIRECTIRVTVARFATNSAGKFPVVRSAAVATLSNHIRMARTLASLAVTEACFLVSAQDIADASWTKQKET